MHTQIKSPSNTANVFHFINIWLLCVYVVSWIVTREARPAYIMYMELA